MTCEGKLPTVLGAVVTGVGLLVRTYNPVWGAGIIGFGLAHLLLGIADHSHSQHQTGKPQ